MALLTREPPVPSHRQPRLATPPNPIPPPTLKEMQISNRKYTLTHLTLISLDLGAEIKNGYQNA